MPARAKRRMTSAGWSGVAMSTSLTARPRSASRTQPPTKRTSCPSAPKAASTARVAPSFIQGCRGIRSFGRSGTAMSSIPGDPEAEAAHDAVRPGGWQQVRGTHGPGHMPGKDVARFAPLYSTPDDGRGALGREFHRPGPQVALAHGTGDETRT